MFSSRKTSSLTIPELFRLMPERYNAGVLTETRSYYFSVGPHKYTAVLKPDAVEVAKGNTLDKADVVLKTTEKLFLKMVVDGKMPGPIDIARGKIKTNDPAALQKLRELFDFSH